MSSLDAITYLACAMQVGIFGWLLESALPAFLTVPLHFGYPLPIGTSFGAARPDCGAGAQRLYAAARVDVPMHRLRRPRVRVPRPAAKPQQQPSTAGTMILLMSSEPATLYESSLQAL